MKSLLFLLFMILWWLPINSQNTIKYAYDASGNRVNREIVFPKSAVARTTEPEVLTDLIAERNIKIYPNPTEGQLKIEFGDTEGIKNCTITIFSIGTGKQIKKMKGTFPVTEIDISAQPFGVYVMKIEIDGEFTSWKIMKK